MKPYEKLQVLDAPLLYRKDEVSYYLNKGTVYLLKNDFFTLIVVFILLIAGGIFLYGKNFKSFLSNNGKLDVTPTLAPNAKTEQITISGSNFTFVPNTIQVTKGDLIKITLLNTSGLHNLTIPALHVSTKTIHAGQQDTVQFIADKTGSYPFYDGYGHHKEFGMIGKLIVQ